MARATRATPRLSYELEADQAAALDLLLAGQTVTAAAAAVGVARETVSRWRNGDANFQAAYNAALQSAYDATAARLLDARARAVERLAALIDSKDEATALKAAAALLRVEVDRPKGRTSAAGVERMQLLDW